MLSFFWRCAELMTFKDLLNPTWLLCFTCSSLLVELLLVLLTEEFIENILVFQSTETFLVTGNKSLLCFVEGPAGPPRPADGVLQPPADVGSDGGDADQPDHSLHRALWCESFNLLQGTGSDRIRPDPTLLQLKTTWKDKLFQISLSIRSSDEHEASKSDVSDLIRFTF